MHVECSVIECKSSKPLSAHKSHVMEASLFTGDMTVYIRGVVPSLGLPLWHEANRRANNETVSGVIHILLSLNPQPFTLQNQIFDSRQKQKQTKGESLCVDSVLSI